MAKDKEAVIIVENRGRNPKTLHVVWNTDDGLKPKDVTADHKQFQVTLGSSDDAEMSDAEREEAERVMRRPVPSPRQEVPVWAWERYRKWPAIQQWIDRNELMTHRPY